MGDGIQLEITEAKLEKLRCSVCKDYLSCAPICLLPDGSNICGQCSPINDDVITYRQLTLEAIMADAKFPCKYKEYGCDQTLVFGCTVDHESTCVYRRVSCASVKITSCTWSGPVSQIPNHFVTQHPSLIKQEAEFIINVEESTKGIIMVMQSDGTFILNYDYDNVLYILYYNIKHFTNCTEDVFCTLKLLNDSDLYYLIQLKGSKCVQYNHDKFLTEEDEEELDINKFLENLDNPKSIKISFGVTIPNCSSDSALSVAEPVINYSFLDSMRCSSCEYYLVPPVYYRSYGFYCCNCSTIISGCDLSYNKRQEMLAGTNFPCRWHNCKFVAVGAAITCHEIQCEYRTYRCLMTECNVICTSDSILEHMKIHKCKYFKQKCKYNTSLSKNMKEIFVFTIISNEIILIALRTLVAEGGEHFISVQTSNFNSKKVTVSVQFSHDHCKCKTRKYHFNDAKTLKYSDLPKCFEFYDMLHGTLAASLE